ncbi:hypothetical protein OESDEN_11972 [Oesophagostomum dentatum]|uniref:Uncharacterized protein n=1 Tax=Oesophagostomum dentatum TaxID=61180 RepID=A0A0B1SXK3_OESDE|nr:hypothetical protein OESDEN_11972 [Oesophagostomum dentatum]
MVQMVSSKSTACYSCVALNYRVTVPSRNGPLPPAQDAKNLSELFGAMRRSGLQVPHLADTCADLSPYSSSSTFMQAPIILCRDKRCAKLLFRFKGRLISIEYLPERSTLLSIQVKKSLYETAFRICSLIKHYCIAMRGSAPANLRIGGFLCLFFL